MARGANGRFLPGQSGNPGGQRAHNDYAAIIRATCDAEDWTAIVERAVTDAKMGDRFARQFLAGYLLGRPVQHHAVETVEPLTDLILARIDKIYGD